jgi:hypothetical protein
MRLCTGRGKEIGENEYRQGTFAGDGSCTASNYFVTEV